MIDLMPIAPGDVLTLLNGADVEVIENIGDGQWVNVRYLTHPDEALVGQEELCHGSDIKALKRSRQDD